MVEPSLNSLSFCARNPLCIAAAALAVLYYGGMMPCSRAKPCRSLLPLEAADSVCGTISSNPVKTASGHSYVSQLRLSSVEGQAAGACIRSQAEGCISVLLPVRFVESRYPGRIAARTGAQGLCCEAGARLCCSGRWEPESGLFLVSTVSDGSFPAGIAGTIARFRAACRIAFRRLLYGWGDAGGLALSLLAGAREYTEPELGDSFRNAGLSHILALSGMHLSFFSGLACSLWSRVFGRRYAFLAQLAGISCFIWFAGATPSLVRAGISALIMVLCGLVSCKSPGSLAVLAATFMIHLLLRPGDLGTAAAELSYGALLGILLCARRLERIAARWIPPAAARALAASAGAQIATAPLSLKLFGSVMPAGIVASLAVSPMVSAFMSLALAAVPCCLAMPFLSPFFGCILKGIYKVTACTVSFFAKVPPLEL